MAPATLPVDWLTKSACIDDLFKVDVSAFCRTLFSLLNLNLKYQFKIEKQTG